MILPEVIIPVIFVLIITVGWFITTYNRFIKYRNNIEEAWSGIEVALKRRFNLIPNLIRAVEGYGEHEAKIFHLGSGNPAGIAPGGFFRIF
jgi:LemA protein